MGIIVLLLVGGIVVVAASAYACGRHVGLAGLVVPLTVFIVLGEWWEWSYEASLHILAVAVVGGGGFVTGLARRRRRTAAPS